MDLTKEDINNIDKSNLLLYSHIIEHLGIKIEFELYEELIKFEYNYEDYENLSEIISIITKEEINPSDLITTEDENGNKLIDLYHKMNESYEYLKKEFNINDDKLNDITNDLINNIPLLKMPHYYLSFPHIFKIIYNGDFNINQIGIINLSGEKDPVNKNLFFKILNQLRNSLNIIRNDKIL